MSRGGLLGVELFAVSDPIGEHRAVWCHPLPTVEQPCPSLEREPLAEPLDRLLGAHFSLLHH